MNVSWKRFVIGCFIGGMAAIGTAQPGWVLECWDRDNPPPAPYSVPYGFLFIGNELFTAAMGTTGNVTYGGTGGPCYDPGRVLDFAGRFAFAIGGTGSVQTDFDDGLAVTMGAPFDAAGDMCYARIIKGEDGSDDELFGQGGLRGSFVGASQRYMVGLWNDADVDVELTIRIIGDAARMQWRITNLQAANQRIGLRFGACAGQRTRDASVTEPGTPYNQFLSLLPTFTGSPKPLPYTGFTYTGTTKPVRNERCYLKDNPKFPPYVNFESGQSYPYGLKIQNVTTDDVSDHTPVDQILIGNYGSFVQPGLIWDNNMRNRVFLDAGPDPLINNNPPAREEADILLQETAFIQNFAGQDVPPGGSRTIVHYLRSPWSVGDYLDPFTVLVDAPRLIAAGPNFGFDDLAPNPFTIRAYLDNQYSQLDREVILNDTRVTITLPAGLTRVAGEPQTKVIPRIDPNEIAFVEWQVIADGNLFGNFPVQFKFETVPGPVKNVTVNIPIAATPRLHLPEGPNLVTIPWNFPDSSLESILSPLIINQDYQAFQWNPELGGYVPATSASRGGGLWIVPTSDEGYKVLQSAVLPADTASGGRITNLEFGWNLIGNPYNYPIQLSTIVAVAQDNPEESFTFQDLITLGFITPSLAYWQRDANDPNIGSYRYTEGVLDYLQPSTGYWIYVSTIRPIRLVWPGVFTEGLPNSGRAPKAAPTREQWKQTDKQWRLQLAAQTNLSLDDQNFVGVAGSAKDVNLLRAPKPPMAPQGRNAREGRVELSIEDQVGGKPMRMARAFIDKMARKEWKVFVKTDGAAEVNLTWPNLTTIPKNVRVRLIDKATSTTRDLRSASGYSFRMDRAGTREFTLVMEPGGASRAVIGNVVVTRPSRDKAAPFTINYTLSADATTSIRILAGTGKEIFAVSRGRSDRSGQNSATWAMRDNANRAVAPGQYRVEILAETANGERVRKIVPVNVVR